MYVVPIKQDQDQNKSLFYVTSKDKNDKKTIINYFIQAFAGEDDGTIDQATLTDGYKDLEKSEDRTLACVIMNFQIFNDIF